jgi:hypothetical protein
METMTEIAEAEAPRARSPPQNQERLFHPISNQTLTGHVQVRGGVSTSAETLLTMSRDLENLGKPQIQKQISNAGKYWASAMKLNILAAIDTSEFATLHENIIQVLFYYFRLKKMKKHSCVCETKSVSG